MMLLRVRTTRLINNEIMYQHGIVPAVLLLLYYGLAAIVQ